MEVALIHRAHHLTQSKSSYTEHTTLHRAHHLTQSTSPYIEHTTLHSCRLRSTRP